MPRAPGTGSEPARKAKYRADQAAMRDTALAAKRKTPPLPADFARLRAKAAKDQLVAAKRQALLSLVGLAEACERTAEAFERLAATTDPAISADHLAKASEHRALAVEYRVRARRAAEA